MRVKGITKRWIINGLGQILILLAIFEIVAAVSVREWYYSSVEHAVSTRSDAIVNLISAYQQEDHKPFVRTALQAVSSFKDKEMMELTIYDPAGRPVASSNGFLPPYSSSPDYRQALLQRKGIAQWKGLLENGERVLMVTQLLSPGEQENKGAVQLSVSMDLIEDKISMSIFLCLAAGLVVMLFAVLSGLYFVRSIVRPVNEIGRTAGKIAQGEFDIRIEKVYNDEIGTLCDTINHMAHKLGESEKRKNDFISSVSHELRTPLTAIKGWAETLQLCNSPEEREVLSRGIAVIEKESDRLTSIVEELLDFSRMQSGHLSLMVERANLVQEASEAVYIFRAQAEKERISLRFEPQEDLPEILGDRNRLKQVFINVIENAIKYSGAYSVVTVRLYAREDKVYFEVEDHGCGIRKEDLPRVKEKFFQVSGDKGGSGIGLSVVDELVRLHRGTFEIVSQFGEGTTVTIGFPLSLTAEEMTAEAHSQQ